MSIAAVLAAATLQYKEEALDYYVRGFYRTTPRSSSARVSGHGPYVYEKKFDTILESIKEQGKKLTALEEKGGQTLESMEIFDGQLELIDSKVNGMKQVISQQNSHN